MEVRRFIHQVRGYLKRPYLARLRNPVICAWCRRGKHRSVALIELLAKILVNNGYTVNVRHVSLEYHKHGHKKCSQCTSGTTLLEEHEQRLMDMWFQ